MCTVTCNGEPGRRYTVVYLLGLGVSPLLAAPTSEVNRRRLINRLREYLFPSLCPRHSPSLLCFISVSYSSLAVIYTVYNSDILLRDTLSQSQSQSAYLSRSSSITNNPGSSPLPSPQAYPISVLAHTERGSEKFCNICLSWSWLKPAEESEVVLIRYSLL